MAAPELDDMSDVCDEFPYLLIASQAQLMPVGQVLTSRRRRAAVSVSEAHGRLLIAAVAAGATAAGANIAVDAWEAPNLLSASHAAATVEPDSAPTSGIQIVQTASTSDPLVHREELARGAAFAQERAQREARLRRPQFVAPTRGILTSGFGARWGSLHAGLDIANSVGTPVYAAADGEVIASGPTPGFGLWVKIRDSQGTVTLYGHIDTTLVQTGERVMAGDQIATMGNRGNSTGPHLHFEVHRNGTVRVDPAAWLQERGVDESWP